MMVHVYRKCGYCKGKLVKKCLKCNGTGKIQASLDGRKEKCPKCYGQGFIICPWCKGILKEVDNNDDN